MKKLKSLHFYILFCIVILFIISQFMRFAVNTRIEEFKNLHNKTAQNITHSTAKNIEQYIQNQHQLLDLFILSQHNKINQLISQPDTNNNLESIREFAKHYFSTYKQLFIVDNTGTPISIGLSSPIGNTCANDVRLYAKSPHLQKLFIHNSLNIGKHIDIVAGLPKSDYFIFVALDIAKIYSIIKPAKEFSYNLALIKKDQSESIELEHLLNNQLTIQQKPEMIFEENIEGTLWKIRTIIDPQILHSYKNTILSRTIAMWLILLIVCLIFLWRLKADLREKRIIKNQLISLNENLEQNIKKRTLELEKSLSDYAFQASHDYLTNLISRHVFEDILLKTIQAQHKKHPFLLYFSLDDFKLVNETSSHSAGDQLLIHLSKTFTQIVSKNNTLARIGSDEFAVILNKNISLDSVLKVAEELSQSTEKLAFEWNKRTHKIHLSIAIIPLLNNMGNLEYILGIANTALGFAKKSKTNKIYIYDKNNSKIQNHKKKLQTANTISEDINNNKFILYGHNISSLQTPLNIRWTEILVRKLNDNGELIQPNYFIPIAEEFNRIDSIDCYVIEQAINWLQKQSNSTRININLSGKTLSNKNLIPFIESNIKTYNVNPSDICFEITETASIDDIQHAINFITSMKNLGCLTALDDFGTGLSSLYYLKRFDVDFVKIDGEFIKDICNNESDYVMVKSITQICKTLNKITIAEYVEDQETADLLAKIGVDYAQGFLYHKPELLN